VLGRLQEKDVVFVTDGGGRAKRYVPVDPEEFIYRYRTRLERALDGLRDDLEALGVDEPVGYIWNLHGRAALLERAGHLMARAERTLLVSGWDEELADLAGAIADAHRRKVRVAVIDYGGLPLEASAVYPHPIKDTIHGEKGGRGLTLCADSRIALLGLVQDDGAGHGAWSRNRAFVAAAEDYLKHDIYVQKIVGRFHDLLVRTYGPNFARWRDVFSDRVVTAPASTRTPRRD
jgi:sugar-specific transcriptional regulator TrmB